MVNVNDFFPLYTKCQLTNQEKDLIDLNTLSSALVLNLPLRYVFQYALNHLQGPDKIHGNKSPPISERRKRNVLIVSGSRAKLQEWMCHEQQLYDALETDKLSQPQNQERDQGSTETTTATTTTTTTHQETVGKCAGNPWDHLFPPNLSASDEFTSATQTQTQSQLTLSQMRLESQGQTFLGGNEIDNGDSGSTDRRRLNFNDVFQPELWSRIQFRYAPSVHHIKSLFRCLHLDSETTQGRTFGHDRGGHSVEERDLQSMPTLVLLIGCFHGLDSYTSSGQSSSSICVLPSHFNSQKSSAETSVLSSGANVGLRPYETHPQPSQISFQSYHSMAQTSSQSVVPRMEGLDRERVQYIKDVSGAISEIKDSLQWIERVSGQNVELLIFENTKDPKSLKNRNTYGLQDSRLPSPQELWLQKVVGFWTDAVLMVQHGINIKSTSWPDQSSSQGMSGGGKVLSGKENNNAQPSKDSFCMWVKTQQSINTMVHGGSIYADEKKASSVGAVVGLHWYYDLTKSSFVFHVVS